ncbi:enoyl-CoA hydratase-related protein [soil metagenome]
MNLVLIEKKERIGFLTINRPEKRNALSFELVTELISAFHQAHEDKEIKVIILKASGTIFCAGADLAYLQKLQSNTFEENLEDSRHLKDLYQLIYTMDKVVIAQINGHAIAGGCGLASICDFSFAVPEAKFGYTEVRIGFVPALVNVFLLRKLGEGRSRQLLLGGNLIDAVTAMEMGLINWVVPAIHLEERVIEFARSLCIENSAESMAYVKKIIAEVPGMELNKALEYSATLNAQARASEDCKKGISAFLNKEKITW